MRLIDADEVVKALDEALKEQTDLMEALRRRLLVGFVKQVLSDAPTVEPKHGHWVYVGHGWAGESIRKCSICGHQTPDDGNYCSNCGAKMDEVKE